MEFIPNPKPWLMGFIPALTAAIPSPPQLAHFITVAQLESGASAILLLVNTVDQGQVFLQLTEEDFVLPIDALVEDVRQKIAAQREVKP